MVRLCLAAHVDKLGHAVILVPGAEADGGEGEEFLRLRLVGEGGVAPEELPQLDGGEDDHVQQEHEANEVV